MESPNFRKIAINPRCMNCYFMVDMPKDKETYHCYMFEDPPSGLPLCMQWKACEEVLRDYYNRASE